MADLYLHSKRVIAPDGVMEATVIIRDEKILAVKPGTRPHDVPVTDVGNKIIMAGVIDPHVHINEPGRTEWEGFETATRSALTGGITTLVDMPLNASPVTTSVEAFDAKAKASENKRHVNCFFWGGIIPGNEHEIEPLIGKGVRGFKAFLTHSGIDEFPNVTEAELRKAMPILAKYGLPLLVHCELSDESNPLNGCVTSYQQYLSSRPRKWEDDAIAMMIRLCKEFHCRVHIVHLSSSDSISQIKAAKLEGAPLTVETAQHYLYFNSEEIPDGATQFKCAPPIRERENNELLWQALREGIIDFVATDHSPATPDLKEVESGDFSKAWGGIASLQLALPILWTAAMKRNCTIRDVAKWLCENPAKLIGCGDQKGKIAAGYDADVIVWDDEKTFVVSEAMIQHKHKITPYLGEELCGIVEQVYLGGELKFSK